MTIPRQILSYSGRKTIRAFRRKDGKMIANFRVQADLKGMETTTDGRCCPWHDLLYPQFLKDCTLDLHLRETRSIGEVLDLGENILFAINNAQEHSALGALSSLILL